MRRNKNIDIVRALAIIMVVIYHFYVLVGLPLEGTLPFLNNIINLGGEIGVTLFFIISGFGIYNSIYNMTKNDSPFSFAVFIKKRLKRILPEYYFCLIVLLLLTGGAVYLLAGNYNHVISHGFMFHNLFPDTHGSINGVLWTMGVIFQFYLISYFLFKLISKRPYFTYLLSVVVAITLKIVFYRYVVAPNNLPNVYYFIYGRQLWTAMDNFVIGMILAKMVALRKNKEKGNGKANYLLLFSLLALFIVFLNFSGKHQIYGANLYSFVFHTALALLLALIIFIFLKIELNEKKIPVIILDFISKYEYGIYLWHLILMQNLLTNSSMFAGMRLRNQFIILFLLSIGFGYLSTKIIEKFDFESYIVAIKNNGKKVINILMISFLLCSAPFFIRTVKDSFVDIINIRKGNIKTCDNLSALISNANETIPANNKYTYIYIDGIDTEGYMNFYRMRYYLSPNSSIYYNTYTDLLNSGEKEKIFEYLKEIDFDYFIIRRSSFIEEILNVKIDVDGVIYKKNKGNISKIEDLFLKIEK